MTAPSDLDVSPEFSRVVRVAELGDEPTRLELTANADECAALAKRFGLEGIGSLVANISLTLLPNKDVRLDATFNARVKQTCVVTSSPMNSKVYSKFTTTYSEDADEDLASDEEEIETLNNQIELPEPLIEEKIDIGEAISEQFALEIDPFPRVKGTVFDGYSTGRKGKADAPLEKKNPFAVLSQLKTKQEKKK